MTTTIWRRRAVALLVLAAVAAIVVWVLRSPQSPVGPADRHGARVAELELRSEAVGETLPTRIVVPDGGAQDRPLLVFLHGRGADEESYLGDEMFAALADAGMAAPVVAFPYGGEGSYWHDRETGAWGEYVVDEVIPRVAREVGADPRRVAIGGISMGGYGAYSLASEYPGRFCAVGGHSPALWRTAGETAPGAFDDAEDFSEHDVIASVPANPGAFTGQPVWLETGDEDPFVAGDNAVIAALEAVGAQLTAKRWPGGHDSEYWAEHWDEYVRFYSRALREC